jgi:hypothetical protein
MAPAGQSGGMTEADMATRGCGKCERRMRGGDAKRRIALRFAGPE